jgi:hypothetical protein
LGLALKLRPAPAAKRDGQQFFKCWAADGRSLRPLVGTPLESRHHNSRRTAPRQLSCSVCPKQQPTCIWGFGAQRTKRYATGQKSKVISLGLALSGASYPAGAGLAFLAITRNWVSRVYPERRSRPPIQTVAWVHLHIFMVSEKWIHVATCTNPRLEAK